MATLTKTYDKFFKDKEDMTKEELTRVLRSMQKMEKKLNVHYVWVTEQAKDNRVAYDICFNRLPKTID